MVPNLALVLHDRVVLERCGATHADPRPPYERTYRPTEVGTRARATSDRRHRSGMQ